MSTEEQVTRPLIFQYYTHAQKQWEIFAVWKSVISVQYVDLKFCVAS